MKIKRLILIPSFILASLFFTGTSSASELSNQGSIPEGVTRPVVFSPGARFGNVFHRNKQGAYFLDPVCGKVCRMDDSTASVEVAGKSYCLDGLKCAVKFQNATPEYLSKLRIPGRVQSIQDGKVEVSDPVVGTNLTISPVTPFSDFGGKRYYFLTDSSRGEFAKSPGKYVMSFKRGGGSHTGVKPVGESKAGR
jgi:YHS domain-containing protein